MAAAKSSYLQLFDNESKDDSYSFLVSNVQAKLSFEDALTAGVGRPMEFKSKGGYKYIKTDGVSSFDLDPSLRYRVRRLHQRREPGPSPEHPGDC